MALLYHPDKNFDKNSTEKFQQIKEAYDYMLKNKMNERIEIDDDFFNDNENLDKNSYPYFLYSFLKTILPKDKNELNISTILQNISNTCEDNALEMIKKLDKNLLIKTYEILKKYYEVLHIPNLFLEKIKKIISEKMCNDECIILNPTLNDLFENNLYRLNINGFLYVIPLWHHELIYDNSGNEIYIKCSPELPENIEIDNDNNIIIYKSFLINEIWNKEILFINIGERVFEIKRDELLIKREQTVVIKGKGISKINTRDIYDISNKSDIIIDLCLYLDI